MNVRIGHGLFKLLMHMGLKAAMHIQKELLHEVVIREILPMQCMLQHVDVPLQAVIGELAIQMLTRLMRDQGVRLQEGMTCMNKKIVNDIITNVMLMNNLRQSRDTEEASRLGMQD